MAGEPLTVPPRRPGAKSRRPRVERTLSRDAIVAAALRVIDEEGVDAVTMRRIGQELGTGGASLYAHIDGKDELLELVFDHVAGEIPVITPDPRRWQEQLKDYLRQWHAILRSHRDLAKIGLGRVPIGPNSLVGMECMLAVMRAGKLDDAVIGYGADLLAAYVTGSAYEGSIWMSGKAATPEAGEAYHRELETYFSSLPADRFPTLISLIPALMGDPVDDADVRFEFGLDVLLRGLVGRSKR
ncbi:MAG TPA: TetR/AcrR family transcriptional regulator [Mycobacteriales bacterium]|jgi:AcrR family transcriptional regulator|nr:TetR/AcrR family transcriptional regulator [Mycobacteriales bacterium]